MFRTSEHYSIQVHHCNSSAVNEQIYTVFQKKFTPMPFMMITMRNENQFK